MNKLDEKILKLFRYLIAEHLEKYSGNHSMGWLEIDLDKFPIIKRWFNGDKNNGED